MSFANRTGRSMFVTTLLFAAVCLLSAMPAHADNVTVNFSYGPMAGQPQRDVWIEVDKIHCQVTVAEGTSASGVLDAAVQQGCIVSWQPTPGGSSVACIDYVCGLNLCRPLASWSWHVAFNGSGGPYAFNHFRASPGSMIEATYVVPITTCPLF